MKFIGTPNLYVHIRNKRIQRLTRKKGLRFDENGFYETDNPILTKALSQHFQKVEPAEDPFLKAYYTYVKERADAQPAQEEHETPLLKCKHCEFTTDSNGKLMAHYKKEHPKPKG
jgi:hypothetical protein